MKEVLFSGPSAIFIQGIRVLRLVAREPDHAFYEVIGFENMLFIMDYRDSGLRAIDDILHDDQLNEFADKFNVPAFTVIEQSDQGQIFVSLYETFLEQMDYMVWIAVGLEEQIPNYDYMIEQTVPVDDDHFALFALYRRPPIHHSSSKSLSSRNSQYSSSSSIKATPTSLESY